MLLDYAEIVDLAEGAIALARAQGTVYPTRPTGEDVHWRVGILNDRTISGSRVRVGLFLSYKMRSTGEDDAVVWMYRFRIGIPSNGRTLHRVGGGPIEAMAEDALILKLMRP